MKKTDKPGIFSRAAAYVLLMGAVLFLTLAIGLSIVSTLASDSSYHERVALHPAVQEAQEKRIELRVNELARQWHFAPEAVLPLVTGEPLKEYNLEIISWWQELLRDLSAQAEVPFISTVSIQEAVRADELFREHTPANQRKTIARDKVAYEVGECLQRTVMPLRPSVLSLGVMMMQRELPVTLETCLMYARLAAWGAFGVFAVLLVLVRLRHRRYLVVDVLHGVSALIIVLMALTVFLMVMDFPGQLARLSEPLGLQAEIFMGVEWYKPVLLALALAGWTCLSLRVRRKMFGPLTKQEDTQHG